MFHFLKICGISYIMVVFLMPKLTFFSSFHLTRNGIVERLKRGPQARPTGGFYGYEKFEKMALVV